ncbi:MAG TPA: hypothetical protein VGN16_06770 [Acidobacteriaceae bacterium]|jgi:hypothetical protein
MNLEGWLPADVVVRAGGRRIAWTLRGREPLRESSFEQTLQDQMAKPFHQLFRRETSLEAMAAWVENHPPAPLRGIVFHTAHCGSRALARFLANNGKNRVAAQPTPLDSLLRLGLPNLPRSTQVVWLRAMAGALGQPQAAERASFLLLHPWHIHSIDLFREAFPETPWIFLYDEPVAWLQSILRNPPMWTIPSLLPPEELRLELCDWLPQRPEIYPARALTAMYRASLDAVRTHSQGLLINRGVDNGAAHSRVARHFGLEAKDVLPSQGREASHTNLLAGDSRLRDVANEYLQGLYEELEALRR